MAAINILRFPPFGYMTMKMITAPLTKKPPCGGFFVPTKAINRGFGGVCAVKAEPTTTVFSHGLNSVSSAFSASLKKGLRKWYDNH